ncbi:Type II toxin-antitoxin system VapC family toxin [Cupriavidus sp. H18C1]|uniref:type II toxin-antitoxin system VapC family toxin n=1 Tax=Cupriavidus sp. H18C1 TaxID=3241601 RepID=UPI003BB95D3D
MKLLFDTHILLWALVKPGRLPTGARLLIEDDLNEPVFSAASIWEIAIKASLCRRSFDVDPKIMRRGLLESGYRELPIVSEHAMALEDLPLLHKDPFDRVLVAQAIVEDMALITADPVVARYPGPVRHV